MVCKIFPNVKLTFVILLKPLSILFRKFDYGYSFIEFIFFLFNKNIFFKFVRDQVILNFISTVHTSNVYYNTWHLIAHISKNYFSL